MNIKLKKTLYTILTITLIIYPQFASSIQEKERVNEKMVIEKHVMEFAQKSLERYVEDMVNEKNYMKFGFKSLDEAQKATVGKPLRVMSISLDDMKAYEPESKTRSLLKDTKTFWFPVMVQNQARTKLEIIDKNGRLISGEFGRIKVVKEITEAKTRLQELLKSKEVEVSGEIILARVQAMRAEFLYIESSKGDFLVPAMIQPQRFELKNAQIYSAAEVLLKMKEYARKIDGKKIR